MVRVTGGGQGCAGWKVSHIKRRMGFAGAAALCDHCTFENNDLVRLQYL